MIVLDIFFLILVAFECAAGLLLFSALACNVFDALMGREQPTFPYEKVDRIGQKYLPKALWDESERPSL